MKLNCNDLEYLCNIAIQAAKKAGTYIAKQANTNITVNKKDSGEFLASQVVTEVDLKSQEIILDTLSSTIEKYDLAVLTEESADDKSRLEKDYFWCIDPLDGTLPFIERMPGYSVALALVKKDGTPQIGVIYDPRKQVLYHSIINKGAFINGRNWKVNNVGDNNRPLFFIVDRSFLKHDLFLTIKEKLLAISKKLGLHGLEIINYGGGAMNALWVIEHAPACYFKLPIM